MNYYISWCYIYCAISEYYWKDRGLPYTLKSPNKQLMHTFLYFVVSLQSIFCTLGLIFVFDVNIYSSSLRLFKINLVVSVLPATNRQYFVLALSLALASCYICFKYLDPVKRVIFPASDKATFDFIEISPELRILESVICTFSKLDRQDMHAVVYVQHA